LAVTTVSALIVTAHVTPEVDEHPVHEENLLAPDLAGAVNVNDTPEL
jgi:hypothetical protein